MTLALAIACLAELAIAIAIALALALRLRSLLSQKNTLEPIIGLVWRTYGVARVLQTLREHPVGLHSERLQPGFAIAIAVVEKEVAELNAMLGGGKLTVGRPSRDAHETAHEEIAPL